MPGSCFTNCFTSRFKSRSSPTLFGETLSNTTSSLRAADELGAAQPPSPALETASTGPVFQHAEEGTESPRFELAPQQPTPPLPSAPPAHPRPSALEIVPAGKLVPPLDGAGKYNGSGPTPLSAITEASKPLPSAGTGGSIRGGYLSSNDKFHPPAPPTPPLPPAPPVPPAHPRPSAPEIVRAGKLVPPLDGAGEYNGSGPTPLSAITKGSEPLPSQGPGATSIRGGYLPSTDELDPPPPYSSSQPSFPPPTLARSTYNCSRCHQPFETGCVLRRSTEQCVGPEIARCPFKCDKCSYTLDKGDLLELHYQKCIGHGGAFINAEPFRPKPNITRIMEKMGDKEGKGLGRDGTGRTTPFETTVLRHGVGLGHVQVLPSTDTTCPPSAHSRAESDIELDDLAPVPRSAAPPVPEVAPTINSIPNLDSPAVSTTEHGGSMNAMIPAKDTTLRFPCRHCARSYFHTKHQRRHLLRHREDLPYMCLLCAQKFLSQDIYTRHLQRCAESKKEHEEERGRAGLNSSPRSGVEPRTPPLMSPDDIALPPSSSSEEAFSPGILETGIVMTPPSESGSGVQLSETTAVVLHEPPNASNGIILTGWPKSRPGGRRQLYFAYGSNLSTSQMAHRCPSSYLHSSPIAVLRGWEWFVAARGYASIRQVEGVENKEAQERILEKNKVSRLLYWLDTYSESRLDQAEGVGEGRTGSYYKDALEVELLLPDGAEDPEPKKVWCLTYIDCSGDEDGEIREEYKSRLKKGMIESSRLGLGIGGIFGPWQNEVCEAESSPKAGTSLRGERKSTRLERDLKRKVSCKGSVDCIGGGELGILLNTC